MQLIIQAVMLTEKKNRKKEITHILGINNKFCYEEANI